METIYDVIYMAFISSRECVRVLKQLLLAYDVYTKKEEKLLSLLYNLKIITFKKNDII